MMSGYRASDALSSVDFISAKDVLAYASVGVGTVVELLDKLPKRYEDRRRFDNFPVQAGGGSLCLRGTVVDTQVKRFGGRKQFFEAILVDLWQALIPRLCALPFCRFPLPPDDVGFVCVPERFC